VQAENNHKKSKMQPNQVIKYEASDSKKGDNGQDEQD
jgi:hypothetical protein